MGSPDQYRVVFDFAEKGFQWWFPAIGFIFVFLGVVLIWLGRRNQWRLLRRIIGYYMVGFSLLWFSMTLGLMLPQYLRLRSAYERHNFSIVEGHVRDFRPMPYQGHQDECFTVRSATFCYSDYDISPGFNNSASHGGPIREGLPVRISYVGGTILRLEIRADKVPSVAERKAFAETAKADWEYRSKQDPRLEGMDLGFAIAALFLAGWWNLQPRRFMRFWLKPPYRPWILGLFRVFFAANLFGALWYLVQQLVERHRSVSDLRYAALIGAAWILAIWFMVNVVEWVGRRQARDATMR